MQAGGGTWADADRAGLRGVSTTRRHAWPAAGVANTRGRLLLVNWQPGTAWPTWFCTAARCTGVQPRMSLASRSAGPPRSSSTSTAATWPRITAWCSGVRASPSRAVGSAPCHATGQARQAGVNDGGGDGMTGKAARRSSSRLWACSECALTCASVQLWLQDKRGRSTRLHNHKLIPAGQQRTPGRATPPLRPHPLAVLHGEAP